MVKVLVACLAFILVLLASNTFAGLSNWRTFYATAEKLRQDANHWSDAEAMYQAALRDGQFFCVTEQELCPAVVALADLYIEEGKPEKAFPYYSRALKAYGNPGSSRNLEIAHCLLGMAKGLALEEMYARAIPCIEQARSIMSMSGLEKSPEFEEATVTLAYMKSKTGDIQGASDVLTGRDKSKS